MKTKAVFLSTLVLGAAMGLSPQGASGEHSDTEISTSLDQLTGVWESEGYGRIVQIHALPARFDRYEISGVSCLLIDSGPLDLFYVDLARLLRNAASTRFTYMMSGSLTTYAYNRLSALPELCRNGGTGPDADPLVNFDVLWATFDEQYAFFGQRGADWNALRGQMRSRLNGSSSDQELFDLLSELVTPLCDGHVQLNSDTAQYNGAINPSCASELVQELLDEFAGQTQYTDPFDYYQQVFVPSVLETIESGYLQGSLSVGANDKIQWGDLGAGIGYLNVLGMADLAGPDSSAAADLGVLGPVLDSALASFDDDEALVIDIRLNSGGYDHVALDLASRFTDQPRVAFTKRARWGDDFTARQAHLITPSTQFRFTGPIVILTSGLTASAAENFLLAMRSLPQVVIVGETTLGVHSDVLPRRLPNGWTFTLSNEVFEAPDGTLFEGRGFEADIEVPALRAANRAAGVDAGIEAARERLERRSIDPALSGTWWNPARGGEGYMFDFLTFGSERYLFVAFYTYDADGSQAYLVGTTTVLTNPVTIDVGITHGGVFGPDYDPSDQVLTPWGTLTVELTTCTEATVLLTPDLEGFQAYSDLVQRFGDAPTDDPPCL